MFNVVKFGVWYHIHNHYMPADAPGGLFLDVCGESPPNFMDASASVKKDRVGLGTGVWRLMPALTSIQKKLGEPVLVGDTFYLQNFFGAQGFLYSQGECKSCKDQNNFDVCTSVVKAPGGSGSKSTIWTIESSNPATRPGAEILLDQTMHIRSVDNQHYLDTCGAGTQGNRNDVSLSSMKNRDQNSGMWSIMAYDDAAFKAEVDKEKNILPNTIQIEGLQCVIPSSGMASASVFGTAAGIIGGAIGAVAITAASGPAVIGTGGALAPAAAGVIAMVATSAATYSALVGVGVQKLSTTIGHTIEDQAYLKISDSKIWPADGTYKSLNKGEKADIELIIPRDPSKTYRIEIYEHDIILSDDLLAVVEVGPGAEWVHAQIPCINDAEGSAYVLSLSATGSRSSHEVLLASHAEAMSKVKVT